MCGNNGGNVITEKRNIFIFREKEKENIFEIRYILGLVLEEVYLDYI